MCACMCVRIHVCGCARACVYARARMCVCVCVCVCVCEWEGVRVRLRARATLRAAMASTKAFRLNMGRVALRVSMPSGPSSRRSCTPVAPNSSPVSLCSRFACALAGRTKSWTHATRSDGVSTQGILTWDAIQLYHTHTTVEATHPYHTWRRGGWGGLTRSDLI